MIRLIVLLVAVSSCSTPGLIELKKDELKAYSEYSSITHAKERTVDFEIADVIDARANKQFIGQGLVGVYFKKTPVALYKETSSFIKDYFYSALAARNFTVAENSENKLVIVINKLWVDELIEKFKPERAKCEAELTFKFTNLKKQTKVKLWTSIISKGDMGDATHKLSQTFSSCLNEIVEKLVKNKALYDFI